MKTTVLLQRWHSGEEGALNELLSKHLEAVRARVRQRLGRRLRAKLESGDVVQEVMIRFLKDGPRTDVMNGQQFRNALTLIVENALRDKFDFFTAMRRDMRREDDDPEAVVSLGGVDSKDPSDIAAEKELSARVRLGIEFLRPHDRNALLLRTREQLAFREIGRQLGLEEDAARMTVKRAEKRLRENVAYLRKGMDRSLPPAHLRRAGLDDDS